MGILVVGAAIVVDGRVLAARRSSPPGLAGRWEFPGGKVESGESLQHALERECTEELGVSVRAVRELGTARGDIELRLWLADLLAGTPAPIEDHDELRWLAADELCDVDWLPIDADLLDVVRPVLR